MAKIKDKLQAKQTWLTTSLRRMCLIFFMMFGASGCGRAQTNLLNIQAVSDETQGAGAVMVRMVFSDSFPPVRSFTLQKGRVQILDLPAVFSSLGRQEFKPQLSLLSKIDVASNAERLRVVFHLNSRATLTTVRKGRQLQVWLQPIEAESPEEVLNTGQYLEGVDTQPLSVEKRGNSAELGLKEAFDAHLNFKKKVSYARAMQRDIGWRRVAWGGGTSEGGEGQERLAVETIPVGASVPWRKVQVAASSKKADDSRDDFLAIGESLVQAKAIVARANVPGVTKQAFEMHLNSGRRVVVENELAELPFAEAEAHFSLPTKKPEQEPAPLRELDQASKPGNKSHRRISMAFQSVEIRSALQAIANFSGFNLVASDAVGGELTVQLKGVPWRDALRVILDAKGLGMRERDNVIWVAPKADLLAYQEHEIKSREASRKLEPLVNEVFRLNYAKADQVLVKIKGSRAENQTPHNSTSSQERRPNLNTKSSRAATTLMSARGVAFTDLRTNQLFVTDTQSAIDSVREFIRAVDLPMRQVLIEAKIVEADDNFSRNLGVRLGVGKAETVSLGSRLKLGPNYDAVSATGATSVLPYVNLPATGLNGFEAASFAVSLFGPGASRFLNLEVSAMEADGLGKIISSPRIVTADQVKATIEQGTEFPYQTATSGGGTSVEFRKANLKLEVIPQITPSGHIILDVTINKDSKGETTAAGIAINTKHIQTQVLVENGGTLVIGGILEHYERKDVNQVPGLGGLPIVGNVFKSSRRQSSNAEVVVFLTPRVIEQQFAGIESDRSGRYARFRQVNGCQDAGQALEASPCGQ